VTTKAVRYYESLGLITPERFANGYRSYDEDDVRLVREIRTLHYLGIPVERTRPFLEYLAAGHLHPAADVLAATASVAVGLEILDSRYRDYRFTMADVVADNTSAGRYLIGAPVPVAGIDLRLVGVVLEHNGEVVATASGSASLGHPAAAVAWLVRALAAEGEGLLAGDVDRRKVALSD
jgi:DNA-binding transcriptional MerR regulator